MFSSILKCSQMSGVFYHSIIHSLASSFALRYRGNVAKSTKHAFSTFYTLAKYGFLLTRVCVGPMYIVYYDYSKISACLYSVHVHVQCIRNLGTQDHITIFCNAITKRI